MKEITITALSGVPSFYLLTGDADCLTRAFFQANSQGWLPNCLNRNQISVLISLSIDEVKTEVQTWFNPDVVKVIIK